MTKSERVGSHERDWDREEEGFQSRGQRRTVYFALCWVLKRRWAVPVGKPSAGDLEVRQCFFLEGVHDGLVALWEWVAKRRLNLFRLEVRDCPAEYLDSLKAATAGFPQRNDLGQYKIRC